MKRPCYILLDPLINEAKTFKSLHAIVQRRNPVVIRERTEYQVILLHRQNNLPLICVHRESFQLLDLLCQPGHLQVAGIELLFQRVIPRIRVIENFLCNGAARYTAHGCQGTGGNEGGIQVVQLEVMFSNHIDRERRGASKDERKSALTVPDCRWSPVTGESRETFGLYDGVRITIRCHAQGRGYFI